MAKDGHAHRLMAALRRNERDPVQPTEVASHIEASWQRCVRKYSLEPDRVPEPRVLARTELHEVHASFEEVLALSQGEFERLYQSLAEQAYVMLLANAGGVAMGYRSPEAVAAECLAARVLPGSVWTEENQGTNGIGVCLKEQRPLSVVMEDHFATQLSRISCTVAPVFAARGELVAVLNATSMHPTDHAMQTLVRSMVMASARRIENLYFGRLYARHIILRLARHNDFCDGAAEGRLALDDSGRVMDASALVLKLLSRDRHELIGRRVRDLFDGIDDLGRPLKQSDSAIEVGDKRLYVRVIEPNAGGGVHTPPQSESYDRSRRKGACATNSTQNIVRFEEIAGTDSRMQECLSMARRFFGRRLPILLQGESGTGKTLLARALHETGPGRDRRFVH
jgi:transcriptional regulator of acetoin/glycerol metabolism